MATSHIHEQPVFVSERQAASLRDQFAMAAMIATLNNSSKNGRTFKDYFKDVASLSYTMADYMMKQREVK